MAWCPFAFYGPVADMSDADLTRWALDRLSQEFQLRAKQCRGETFHTARFKPSPDEAALYDAIAARLTAAPSQTGSAA